MNKNTKLNIFIIMIIKMFHSKLGNQYNKSDIIKTDELFHHQLKTMYQNKSCHLCNTKPANWATLKIGKFICINCAQILRADSSNLVKSCMGTYLWGPDELEMMRINN